MNIKIGEMSSTDGDRRVINRKKASVAPFTVDTIKSNRHEALVFQDLFAAVEFTKKWVEENRKSK